MFGALSTTDALRQEQAQQEQVLVELQNVGSVIGIVLLDYLCKMDCLATIPILTTN
jgi:hypothetical protein